MGLRFSSIGCVAVLFNWMGGAVQSGVGLVVWEGTGGAMQRGFDSTPVCLDAVHARGGGERGPQ